MTGKILPGILWLLSEGAEGNVGANSFAKIAAEAAPTGEAWEIAAEAAPTDVAWEIAAEAAPTDVAKEIANEFAPTDMAGKS